MRNAQSGYGDLLTGSYDCVDRIVLNAYYPMGHGPGGFRVWWRKLHNGREDQLDDNHLMRMAGRFARRVRAWGAANEVPVILLPYAPGARLARELPKVCTKTGEALSPVIWESASDLR